MSDTGPAKLRGTDAYHSDGNPRASAAKKPARSPIRVTKHTGNKARNKPVQIGLTADNQYLTCSPGSHAVLPAEAHQVDKVHLSTKRRLYSGSMHTGQYFSSMNYDAVIINSEILMPHPNVRMCCLKTNQANENCL
ncbi:unnamed protein product [Boreogadus saida]